MAGLLAGLVATSSARSSWAARSSNTLCPPRNYGWQRWYTGWAEAVLHDRLSVHQAFNSAWLPAELRLTCETFSPVVVRTPYCKQTLLLTESRRQGTFNFQNHYHARTVPWMSCGHSVFLRRRLALRPFFILKCCVGEALHCCFG